MLRRLLATTAAVVLLAGCGSGDDPDPGPSGASSRPTSDSPDPSPTESADGSPTGGDPGPVVTCPRADQQSDPELPAEVPEGATSVRLCAGGADRVTPPLDALTTEVASVVSAVNDQPLVTRGCADRQLPTYQLAFGYPDGARFVVAGRFTGCGELLVGSARRARAGPPLRSFVERLLDQRSSVSPPDRAVDPDDLACSQPREEYTWPLADPAGLTVGVLCVGDPDRPGRARRVVIPADDLAGIARSMQSDIGPTEITFGCPRSSAKPWIVGANAWGDPVTVTKECFGFTVTDDLEWHPRGEAREIVRRLVAQAR